MNKLTKKLKGDIVVWTVLGILSIFSLLAVYSSTGNLSMIKQGGNTEYYVLRQGLMLAFGLMLLWFIHKIKWSAALKKSAKLLLIISIILLICTFLFGVEVNGAKRWLRIPLIGLQFQTSDLVKILFIIYLASVLPKAKSNNYDFLTMLKKIYAPIWIVCGLILPMNFSTAAMLFLVSCVMVFIGQIPFKSLLTFFGITFGVGLVVVVISLADPDSKIVPKRFTVWTNRITSFASGEEEANSDDTYQADQAKIAVVRGGFFGTGPGNSRQRNYLPHPDCDFIFAIIIEEYGLILGAIPIIVLYLILLYRGMKISRECEKPFSTLMVFGIVFIYVVQSFIHMGVCVGLGPVTGQNLPMVSTGGTALIAFCIAMGFVMSESRINNKKKAELMALAAAEEAALLVTTETETAETSDESESESELNEINNETDDLQNTSEEDEEETEEN
ncbi:MAG: FtsW/RodA/SpoVE family cell cycle protein [Bacteroidales bacterium]|nr:FtsW/RodA/SpoVE family cell cycle protein [Bacteroidales bacterium]